MKFTIEKVCKLTGISAATLRNWEKRYGFPTPERAGSGHRFYCSSDVEFLKKVKEWVASGHNLSQIASCYRERSSELQNQKASSPDLIDDVDYRIQLLYDCLIRFDHANAMGHYLILNAKLSPEMFFDRVFGSIFEKSSSDLKEKKITSVQEQFATSFARLRLASFLCLDLPLVHNKKVLAATQAAERHEGGILLAAAHLKFRGYPVHYFGPNLPIEDIVGLTLALKPQCVLLSYGQQDRFMKDLKALSQIQTSVCVRTPFADEVFFETINEQIPENLYLSTKKLGSDAASFVEMICQTDNPQR
jgi:DNA-binding transcriptional MerR regulator